MDIEDIQKHVNRRVELKAGDGIGVRGTLVRVENDGKIVMNINGRETTAPISAQEVTGIQ